MIPPLPIDQQITKALEKYRKEHYPHKAQFIYVGHRQKHELAAWTMLIIAHPSTFNGVSVVHVDLDDHLNIG